MFQPIVFSILFVTLVSAASVKDGANDITTKVVVVDDVSKLKDFKQRGVLTPIPRSQSRDLVRYTLGNRHSNDRLVAQNSDSFEYGSPQNVQMQTQYPSSGVGAVITAVEIIVNQSSNVGQAYVVAGGIGERHIVIIVEAYDTTWFNFIANIYGV